MIARADAAAAEEPNGKRRRHSYEAKIRALEQVKAGRPRKEIAAELCTSEGMLYYWAQQKRLKKLRPEGVVREPRAALATRAASPGQVVPRDEDPRQLTIALTTRGGSTDRAPLTVSERDELILLRVEVARLRRMIGAAL